MPNMLVLGGTQMIGRDFVELCLKSRIYPTIANRGVTNKDLFSDLDKIKIDRSDPNECRSLNKDIIYDLVIDFSCYNIDQFLNVYNNITCNNYILISTLCTFDQNVLNDNSHWLHWYCKNKKIVEDYIVGNDIQNISIVRPCVLYGKYDYTDRFYEKNNTIYWKNSNKIVKQDLYHIPVRKFSKYLLQYVSSNKKDKTVHIDGEGIHYIK